MKKLLSVILMASMIAVMMTGCASTSTSSNNTTAADNTATVQGEAAEDDWSYIQNKGELVIGITIYEPMNYYDADNNLTGFDTEYAQAVCAKLGITPVFTEINWDTKEIELNARSIDCIWNGLTITDDRIENMGITNPYVKNMQVVVIKASNADKYKDASSFSGASVAYEAGSAGEEVANAELSGINGISLAKQTDALMEVKAGTSAAAVLDYTLASSMVGEGTDYSDLMIVDGLELAVEEYGVACRKGSTLVDQINNATAELIADGTMAALAKKYDINLAE
jgi:polar amino acid transport system substrate-binding protein